MRQKEEIKRIQIWKEVVNLSLFTDDIILYVKEPEKPHQKKSNTS
jgi:hypothetical protein